MGRAALGLRARGVPEARLSVIPNGVDTDYFRPAPEAPQPYPAVVLSVATDRPGLLVLHDLYYPGWEATVDGKATPVLRANLLFRGVEVPAGEHRVEFTFRPLSARNLLTAAADLVGGEATAVR